MKKLQRSIHQKDPSMNKYKLEFEQKKKDLTSLSNQLKEEFHRDNDPRSRSRSGGRNDGSLQFRSG